eukprot:TRINITY_DN7918_c0_g1_i2.p1 TRINITY_DN7918_c0_g1~~TRINITY_DN7918_c0_g1_i2.p1  ORF type:complete len:457 (-),score=173.72 TRINITY_DN7918_c0_g1_i2:122-1492(-)
MVRVYTHLGKLQQAIDVANESEDPAACYHLAHFYENDGNVKEAVNFYAKAKCYNHGLRLAMEHEIETEVFSMAMESSGKFMNQAGKFFEDREMPEKAVLLYHKAGNIATAINICFQAQLFDTLGQITDDLPKGTEKSIVNKCCDFFLSHRRYDKAVNMLVLGGDTLKALEMCLEKKVTITEDMSERMTPDKDVDNETRTKILREIAKVCKRQGSYHLATKKYTQAKDKAKAMKVLLKSGDTEKIVFFANMAKQKELYILAGNYLQSLDWRTQPEIMKQIMHFYTKAKAPEYLATFYESCASVEIEEYNNYDKAVGALKESAKYLAKSTMPTRDSKLNTLKRKIQVMEDFVGAKKVAGSNPEEAIKLCTQLLELRDIEDSVKRGDINSLLVEIFYAAQQFQEAFALVQKMKEQGNLEYLDKDMVVDLYRRLNQPLDFNVADEPDHGHNDEDDIQDDV